MNIALLIACQGGNVRKNGRRNIRDEWDNRKGPEPNKQKRGGVGAKKEKGIITIKLHKCARLLM